jgi:hypothetical protein
METINHWKTLLTQWPEGLPKTGVIVTSFNEQIPFVGFMTSESMVLLQRRAPDTLGARQVMFPYDKIQAVKIIDVVKPKRFASLGFQGTLPGTG